MAQKPQGLSSGNQNKFRPDELAARSKPTIQPVPKDDRPDEKDDHANIKENTSHRRQS